MWEVGLCVSIHAPTKSATSAPRYEWAKVSGFNSRTHEGCDGITNIVEITQITRGIFAKRKKKGKKLCLKNLSIR